MNGMTHSMLLVAAAVTVALSAGADPVREDELDIGVDLVVDTDAEKPAESRVVDLRNKWPVETLGEIALAYSAVGWDESDPLPAGATVRLNLLEGTFVGGKFSPGAFSADLATGLTGKGTYGWLPSGVEKKVYRVLHETTRGAQVVEDETLYAYFDFADCEMVTEAEFRRAVLGVTQPVAVTDDARHPWSRIGGDGDGLRNTADGATLAFGFTGAGSFAAELSFVDGTVTVAVDGETVATVSADEAWTGYSWSVADCDVHTLTLTYAGTAGVSVRACALTSGDGFDVECRQTSQLRCDLRTVFPVASLADEALKGLMYSANGWVRNATDDATRTATITARAGTLANGVFTSDGSAEVTVATGLTGEGTVDWAVTEISKKVYQLTHTARKGGTVDAAGTCYGYLDFTHCVSWASQADVEAAVLGAVTHKIAVIQDEDWPWQPVDSAAVRSGIVTDEWLEPDEKTATTFTFKGRGVLHYDYSLSGGELAVIADDEVVSVFAEATTGSVSCQVAFDGFGAHEVSFAYTAVGGAEAALRNVRWEESEDGERAGASRGKVRADLQAGEVRTPRRLADVLPFVYSPTNFIGTVDGKSARVSIVQLEGTDPDVTKWAEVPGTWRKLKESTDEGEVKWRAKKGVWKATFEIFDDDKLKETQIKYFDLRNANGNGFAIILT